MKKLTVSVLVLAALAVLFVTSDQQAEDMRPDENGLVTVVYDLSPLIAEEKCLLPLPGLEGVAAAASGEKYWDHIKFLIEKIRGMWPEGVWEKPGVMLSLTPDNRLVIRNTSDAVKPAVELLKLHLPRKFRYTVEFSIYEWGKKEPAPSLKEVNETALEAAGYSLRFLQTSSASVGRLASVYDVESRSYVGDYEGMIASFAFGEDPVVMRVVSGDEFLFCVTEGQHSANLKLHYVGVDLDGFKEDSIRSHPIQFPQTRQGSWARLLEFPIDKPEPQYIQFMRCGKPAVVVVEVK